MTWSGAWVIGGLLVAVGLSAWWEDRARERVLALGRRRPLGVALVLAMVFAALGVGLAVVAGLTVGPAAGTPYEPPSAVARAVLWTWSVLHLGLALCFAPTSWSLPRPAYDTADLRELGADRRTALTFFWVGFALAVATLMGITIAVIQGLLS